MSSYPSSLKIDPLNWLSEVVNCESNGCLQVASDSTSWEIYLEAGKLVYASNSIDPFERLDRHLRSHISTLYSAVREQWRSQFTTSNLPIPHPDYQAICWLVQRNHLHRDRAAILIQELAKEVLESLLSVRSVNYTLTESNPMEHLPKFCHLDLLALVRSCQKATIPSPNPQLQLHPSVQTAPTKAAFPLTSVQSASMGSSSHSMELPDSKPSLKVYTIVCIDDNPSIVRVIQNFLNDEKFSVLAIDNPVKALMQIVRSKPDLILLDVEMPKLDGYELCSLLRRHPTCKNIPIVMVTGNTGFLDRAKAKLVRASDYLTKPFTQSELLNMVNKYL
jgi:two-component system, chemotaxis family, response regulator PixG